MPERCRFHACAFSCLAAFGASAAALAVSPSAVRAQAPTVSEVQPPNWWVGQKLNPVRLLLHGANLGGATVTVGGSGVRVSNAKVSAAGTYLFCDIDIDSNAAPGVRTLTIATAKGRAMSSFPIEAPLAPAGRFAGFSPDDIIYLIMPDRFGDGDPANDDPEISRGLFDRANPKRYHGGDFQGILDHLPYLKDLGVTALWITPIYDNTNRQDDEAARHGNPVSDYHGYGAVDFYKPEEHFGTMAKLRELVDRAHALGIKVIQDQVANHTSPNHPWARDSPTPTWFNGTQEKHLDNDWNIPSLTDPHASPAAQKVTLDGWFLNYLPDLNQGDPELARYEIQNALWWVGSAGFDGIREDTMPYVPRAFWRDWSRAIREQYPHVDAVGEVYNGDVTVPSFFQGGRAQFDGIDTGFQSVFDFPLFYPIRRAFAEGQSIREVAKMLGHDGLYPDAENLVTFLGLHDMPRFLHETGATIEGLELAQTFLLTTRGIPMLYYGDEIGMDGGADPDNRRDFPGGWPGDTHDAFTPAGRSAQEQAVWAHVRRLTHLRAGLAPLRRGKLIDLLVTDQQYVYARQTGSEFAIVALNNDGKAATVNFEASPLSLPDGAALTDRLGGPGATVAQGRVSVTLPAKSALILTRQEIP